MKGLGTIINVAAVIIGGLIGLLVKSGLKERFQRILTQACGLSTVFIGASGALSGMLKLSGDGGLTTANTMLIVISLVAGGFIGEAINLEDKMDKLGRSLRSLVKDNSNSRFVEGFVTASLVTCVGAMAIVGSIQDGLTGDYSLLFSKSVLDCIIIVIFASSYGVGAIFAALPIAVWQGLITLFAALISGLIESNVSLIPNLSCVGSVLIFCVGTNLAFDTKLKVGNLLPAMLVPVVYSLITG